jgi:hypothetical protein
MVFVGSRGLFSVSKKYTGGVKPQCAAAAGRFPRIESAAAKWRRDDRLYLENS